MTCTSSYSIYAVVHSFGDLQRVLDQLYKCPEGVKCQAVQTAAFAQFRQNVLLTAQSDSVFLSDALIHHSNGMFVVSKRNFCARVEAEQPSRPEKRKLTDT